MVTLPLPLYQCQHTETWLPAGNFHKKPREVTITRCTLLATHRLGLEGEAAIRLCIKHAAELTNYRFEGVTE